MRLALFRRTVAWHPTLLGTCVFVVVLVLVVCFAIGRAHSWLNVERHVASDIIVVPGVLRDEILLFVAQEMQQDQAKSLVTVGGPISQGSFLVQFRDYASLAASTLIAMGVDPARITAVPSQHTKRDRTYESAVALRRWLDQSERRIDSLTVYTTEARARRTLMLFSRALGPSVSVGLVAIADPSYDASAWWTSSQGVRITVGEVIGCLYVLLFFSTEQG